MKKSARYIYPRSIARKRRPWRFLAMLVCVTTVLCFFSSYDDSLKLAFMSSSPSLSKDVESGISGGADANDGDMVSSLGDDADQDAQGAVAQALPAPAGELSSHELAALAAATEEEPERPGLFLATLGDSLTRLQSLPFLLPTPEEAEVMSGNRQGSVDNDAPAVIFHHLRGIFEQRSGGNPYSGPVVYQENERYTVETDAEGMQIYRSTIAKGDTVGVILNDWLGAAEVASLISVADPVYSLKSIREGRPFSIVLIAQTGEFISFIYEIDNFNRMVVERKDSAFVATKEAIEFDTELVRVQGNINSSLFEAVADSGESPVLAVNLAEVFSCEVNFINEIRQGDGFDVLVEKFYCEGEFKGYGQMLAAHFTNQGRTYEAYLFPDGNGHLRYYNAQGEALQKTLLKAPLAFTRVSSGYSMNRRHPVFGNTRPHQGVDYAAPTGTPIKAVGDGVLTKVGWGNGYGNMIIIKHSGGLESQYAHMSGFARGMKSGVQVKQGQTIGYVGATGVATGPHLDFRLRQNGNFINPTKAIVPREDPVNAKRMPQFQQTMSMALAYLKGENELALYKPIDWTK